MTDRRTVLRGSTAAFGATALSAFVLGADPAPGPEPGNGTGGLMSTGGLGSLPAPPDGGSAIGCSIEAAAPWPPPPGMAGARSWLTGMMTRALGGRTVTSPADRSGCSIASR